MIVGLLVIICVLLAGIWWDMTANARATRQLLISASDLNIEKQEATERRLEKIERKLPSNYE
jgi:hypothetical protein